METAEKPVPTAARQRTAGPSAGQWALSFSGEMPSRLDPRHCGQSVAWEWEIVSKAAATNAHFMREILAECGGKSMRGDPRTGLEASRSEFRRAIATEGQLQSKTLRAA